jgi:hypothetical protein
MNRSRLHIRLNLFRRHIGANIFRKAKRVKKEEILLSRLEGKLGKSKSEVKKLLSVDLMKLLSSVPFSY